MLTLSTAFGSLYVNGVNIMNPNYDRSLFRLGLAMAVLFLLACAGLLADPRQLAGAPVWMKPAKFAVSISVYALSLAWVRARITVWPRLIDRLCAVSAWLLALEWVAIAGQAARGVRSHFNTATAPDSILFGLMGTAIGIVWVASAVIAAALWRERFEDRTLGTALRLGMALAVLGSASGGMMVSPTAQQLAGARATGKLPLTGAHTVGGPDGGPGLAGINWSTEHGDLRIPHFVGMHGLQAIPLFALLLGRRFRERTRVRLVWIASGSFLALYFLLLGQALRGTPLVAPEAADVRMFVLWALATAAAGLAALLADARPGTKMETV